MVDGLVSIITPAYNAEGSLGETIASVRAQTWTAWEMVIADDCSRDGTRGLVQKIAAIDSRVRLVTLQENSGPAMARQAALEVARGRYVAFLDADDQWLPAKLERQIGF